MQNYTKLSQHDYRKYEDSLFGLRFQWDAANEKGHMSRQHLFNDSRGRKADFWRVHTRAQPKRQHRHCFQLGRTTFGGNTGGAESKRKFFWNSWMWQTCSVFIVAVKAVKTLHLNTSTKNSVLQALKTTFEKGKHFAIVKSFLCHLSSPGSWNANLNSFSLVCYPRRKLMFGTLFLLLTSFR